MNVKVEKQQLNINILDRAKLIVWDLDDTFWQGTLTEGGVSYSKRYHDIVVSLSRHGIINSISSNNNFEEAEKVLEAHGIMQYFVFPKINWGNKSGNILATLNEALLRPENTIFLDDKPRVQNSVLAQIPNLLAVMTAEEFSECFDRWVLGQYESDPELIRLQRYQLLERKVSEKSKFAAADTEAESHSFLRSCKIQCEIGKATESELSRITELVERSNQINYTQRRDSIQTIRKLIKNEKFECGYIKVRDKFGDYGIAGFYALSLADSVLHHFVFSCRILHMGIETAVHEYLGFPAIHFAPGKAGIFDATSTEYSKPDWIIFGNFTEDCTREPKQLENRGNITFIGPCDLEIIGFGLGSVLGNKLKIEYNVHHRNSQGHYIGAQGHGSLLDLARMPDVLCKYEGVLSQLPWIDPSLFDTSVFEKANSVVVLSSVRNVQAATYIHKSGEFSISSVDNSYMDTIDFTSSEHQSSLEDILKNSICARECDTSVFQDEFKLGGMVSKESYIKSLKETAALMPDSSKLVVLTVVEIPPDINDFEGVSYEFVERLRRQHSDINEAIREASAAQPDKIITLDINNYITIDDLNREVPGMKQASHDGENLGSMYTYYHFERHIYISLGFELLEQMVKWNVLNMTQEEKGQLMNVANSLAPDELGIQERL
ncbi:hypothetical protein [Pseudoalteromonas piscicida]|uniref:hypothetical protein n=1 Tax=Pseudoalteromonas piscicida TaxID=43662 RepID=UPI00309D940F